MALRPAPHASDPFLKPTPQDINADAINDCSNILDRLSAAGSRASCGIFLYLAVQRLITSELSLPRNTLCQSLQPGVLFAPIGCRLCHRLMKCGFAHRLGVGSPYGSGSSQTVCWLAGAYCGGAAARPDFRARPRGRHPSRLAGGQCHWLGNASIADRSRAAARERRGRLLRDLRHDFCRSELVYSASATITGAFCFPANQAFRSCRGRLLPAATNFLPVTRSAARLTPGRC